jgi:glycosyltransferase involved in cell wall biosynthesis
MATGTPVIASPLGSMPELIRDGETGFLVSDLESAVAATQRVGELRRRACRDDVERRFTAERMVADYADVFAGVTGAIASRSSSTSAQITPIRASPMP